MIKGLYEAHLPISDLDRFIAFYEVWEKVNRPYRKVKKMYKRRKGNKCRIIKLQCKIV